MGGKSFAVGSWHWWQNNVTLEAMNSAFDGKGHLVATNMLLLFCIDEFGRILYQGHKLLSKFIAPANFVYNYCLKTNLSEYG